MQPSRILGRESFKGRNLGLLQNSAFSIIGIMIFVGLPLVERVTRSLFSKRVSENSPILEHDQNHLPACCSDISFRNLHDIRLMGDAQP